MNHQEILSAYTSSLPSFEVLGAQIIATIEKHLTNTAIKTQQITGRVKSYASLKAKLGRPDKTYHELWDVTDIIGIRIITYFESSIDEIATLIERHFPVDFTHSSNKLTFQDYGKFGYRSLHYACALPHSLAQEFTFSPQFRFEVQIRTVLQHAWAEIEHDLGYKAQDSIPARIRRRFSRVAGLLELADEEFDSIRQEIAHYTSTLSLPSATDHAELPLDRLSLSLYITSSEVQECDKEIADLLGRSLSREPFYPEYLIKMLTLSGVTTLRDLAIKFSTHRGNIPRILTPYFEFASQAWNLTSSNLPVIYSGYSLFFLAHLLVLDSANLGVNKVGRLARFYHELDYPNDEKTANKVAGDLYQKLNRALA